ncbi:2-keto-4-pentenoate hydratase/2-oxohepta-3-ene-1,7-dioic acid hydratase in catechol pathway [Williamsia limnetica]|uniref:2-keto-4-pentenoate hydratase/2-oxohepta-3-ene-1,7-dioic acid hydratase in catechol pathway n=1 Tax=Williamsia limnetica TaxID=882452 RepID=A0A318RNK6_WILLI|nr:fumarylacetoacetate hydrolase family protein [Williamsia limnetica]PYE13005.1 2-keto-4-pentenoate hydratase/2-oxohepta-3-ene-1,7-dioic acid hydratase in catechol pathway [Williamsia limnetica]
MAIYLSRYVTGDAVLWGVVSPAGITALEGHYATTAELLENGRDDWMAAVLRPPTHQGPAVSMLSPVTTPCRVLCQGANFRQHAIDSGMDPDHRAFNLFFDKTDASVTGPHTPVTRPAHVQLLDHEIELALVIGKAITEPVTITEESLREYVVALTIANDLSARDVQLPQGQYLKGKSYRGFCPLGPVLAVLDDGDYDRLDDLVLRLHVNGDLRQTDTTAHFVYRPAESLTELSAFSDMAVGDVLLTGTPHGTAAKSPPALVRRLATALLPEHVLWKLFIRRNLNGRFLRPGDTVTATIRSSDGALDLGEQRTPIVAPH